MLNRFISKVAQNVASNRQLPGRVNLIKTAIQHPIGFGKTLAQMDRAAVNKGKLLTGKGRFGQVLQKGKNFLNSKTGKNLLVNTGGAAKEWIV